MEIAREVDHPCDRHGPGFVFITRPDNREIVGERLEQALAASKRRTVIP
jgi:hypothetical protein